MITPGTPAKEKPATSKGHASVYGLQCRSTWYQIDGIWMSRCVSFARIGLPLAVSLPETAHEFEPIPSLIGPSRPSSREMFLATASNGTPCAGGCAAG